LESKITTPSVTKLTGIRRGVKDAERTAEFFAWLLGLAPEQAGGGFRLPCANGDLFLHEDVSTPVAIELEWQGSPVRGRDPDGVPVVVSNQQTELVTGPVMLDHVRLNCADLTVTMRFYRELGFTLTWSGHGETFIEGLHEEPVAGADWVHLSGADGYLSLSQADWRDYGSHSPASGPPRFIHIGLAVTDMASVAARLESAGIPYIRAPENPLSLRLYLNDPDGDAMLGTNVELNEYVAGVPRSGRF
jgi:catechol 2,3-dioxygenase-like lactoylglutathione lyase family enzyme